MGNSIEKNLNLARQAAVSGKMPESLRHYRDAIIDSPACYEAVHYFGVLHVDQGDLSYGLSWISRSLVDGAYQSALSLTNRAIALQRLDRISEAEQDLNKALLLDSGHQLTLMNLGHVHRESKNLSLAINFYEKVIVLYPDYHASYDHLTYCYAFPRDLSKRVNVAKRAYFIEPKNANCGFSYSLYCLMTGRFAEGWDLFHFRWRASHIKNQARYSVPPELAAPRFDPAVPQGPVFIWAEQGLGDEIMFLSLLADFVDRFRLSVIVQVDSRTLALWSRSFPDIQFVERNYFPPKGAYHSQLAMGDLPILLRRALESFSQGGHEFLRIDQERFSALQQRTSSKSRLVIGVGWYSSNGSSRCIPLLDLVKVLTKFDVTLVNLQYGDTASEIDEVERMLGRGVFLDTGVDCQNDLDGLSALMKFCDLVISVANATVHLARTLGVCTWGLLPFFLDGGGCWLAQIVFGIGLFT